MSRILLTGATGLVGGELLRLLSLDERVSQIYAPSRRALPPLDKVSSPCDPQLSDALGQLTEPVDSVFCCLGTTRSEAGSKQAFVHADYTLVVDTALIGRKLGAQHMLVVSALGANAHSPFFYNRVKGEMEQALIAQDWPHLTIARPSMLLGQRTRQRLSESLFAPLFRLMPGRWRAIEARDVALALREAAFSPAPERVTILRSDRLREMAKTTDAQ